MLLVKGEGEAVLIEAWTGPCGCRKLRLPEFPYIRQIKVAFCQPCAPTALLLEIQLTPGPECGGKD